MGWGRDLFFFEHGATGPRLRLLLFVPYEARRLRPGQTSTPLLQAVGEGAMLEEQGKSNQYTS